MSHQLLTGYQLRTGSLREQATLVQFLQLSYQEIFPEQTDYAHLGATVKQYFSISTPLWWVEVGMTEHLPPPKPVACLWLGNAVDQLKGDRHAHIFLLYVLPEYRRQGIGSALMRYAEDWARARGDRQIGLQVFQFNQPALSLYQQLGYETQSFWMIKVL
ncbi:MAG: GNAT family N-acetyltransferase [Coleofasciculaceae cyanobacterium]